MIKAQRELLRQRGATLLELILVLAIGASMMAMSVKFFLVYRADADFSALQANVDTVFDAAKNYYYAQCGHAYDEVSGHKPYSADSPMGFLDEYAQRESPVVVLPRTQWLPYMASTLQDSALVDTDAAPNDYLVQFNRKVGLVSPNTPHDVGIYMSWMIYVGVKIPKTSHGKAIAYQRLLGAYCVGDNSAGYLQCNGDQPDYVIWRRVPFAASPDARSDYWPMHSSLMHFKQQYVMPSMADTTYNDVFCGS